MFKSNPANNSPPTTFYYGFFFYSLNSSIIREVQGLFGKLITFNLEMTHHKKSLPMISNKLNPRDQQKVR